MDTVLIFAGGDTPGGNLIEELPDADLIVAADSGYDIAMRVGIAVDVLVGDLDSITTEIIPKHVIVEKYPADKDATDLELALQHVAVERPSRVVVVGGAGGRVDHELAAASLLCAERWSAIDEIDWFTDRGASYVIRRRRVIHGDVGDTISLIPMGGAADGVSTKGLRWDLSDATLAHGTTHGVSNVFTGPVANVRVTSGCLLAVIPTS